MDIDVFTSIFGNWMITKLTLLKHNTLNINFWTNRPTSFIKPIPLFNNFFLLFLFYLNKFCPKILFFLVCPKNDFFFFFFFSLSFLLFRRCIFYICLKYKHMMFSSYGYFSGNDHFGNNTPKWTNLFRMHAQNIANDCRQHRQHNRT